MKSTASEPGLRKKEINFGSIVFVDRLGNFLGSTGLKMIIT